MFGFSNILLAMLATPAKVYNSKSWKEMIREAPENLTKIGLLVNFQNHPGVPNFRHTSCSQKF